MLAIGLCGESCRERMRHRLTDKQVRTIDKPGRYADGDGLYLSVSKSGTRSWTFLYQRNGRRREMGIGGYGTGTAQVSLAIAREKAEEIRSILGSGGDPFVEFSERRDRDRMTFGQAADRFLDGMESSWRNEKHRDQWRMTLTRYAAPIRRLPVDNIAVDDVLRVLRPIWEAKTETASRLRGRIEKVLDFTSVQGWRTGDNPARWQGHLQNVLPSPKRKGKKHHAALPYVDAPAFVETLRKQEGQSARALELTILCATRTSETLFAKWGEIDFGAGLWTIPADRMKAGVDHRVPLPQAALELIRQLPRIDGSEFLFPGQAPRKPLSNMAMIATLRRMKRTDITVHGFRSTFRDWAGEETSFPREVAEQALAHVVGDETERAYRRGDALEKRRALMEAWASYLDNGGKVVRLVASDV